MKKIKTYTQCELRRDTENGYVVKVCWIPTYGAIINNVVTLDDSPEKWTVHHVGATQLSELIEKQSHDSNKIWGATSGPCPRGNK